MESVILLVLFHLAPIVYFIYDHLIKIFATILILILAYVIKSLLGMRLVTDECHAAVVKSGKFLTKSSLTLNDLRLIKFKNLINGSDSNKNSVRSHKFRAEDDQVEKSTSGHHTKSNVNKSSTNLKHDLELMDRATSQDTRKNQSDNKNSNSHMGTKSNKSSTILIHSQEASLLTIVVKKNKWS